MLKLKIDKNQYEASRIVSNFSNSLTLPEIYSTESLTLAINQIEWEFEFCEEEYREIVDSYLKFLKSIIPKYAKAK